MTKVLKCNDLNPGCTFEARGNSDEDVLKKAAEHAKPVQKWARFLRTFWTKLEVPSATKAKRGGKKRVPREERSKSFVVTLTQRRRQKCAPPSTFSSLRADTHDT